jgi:hypothetical protein
VEVRLRALLHRLFGSASAILILVVLVMAVGIFGLLGMQFQAAWQQLSHANHLSRLAAADRQDNATLAQIDHALDAIARRNAARAA